MPATADARRAGACPGKLHAAADTSGVDSWADPDYVAVMGGRHRRGDLAELAAGGQTVSVAAEAGSASASNTTGTTQASSINTAVATRISRRHIARVFPGQDDMVMSATRPLAHHSHRKPPDAGSAQSPD
jgi:hypothetical protein